MTVSLLRSRPVPDERREPINIAPPVKCRLRDLLFMPEMQGVGYSEFINRACEAAETEIMEHRARNG